MLHAQDMMSIGARINSMGSVSVAIPDHFSVFSNPSTSCFDMKKAVVVYFDHRYSVAGLNAMAFAYNHPVEKSILSTGLYRFGDELLNYNRLEMAFSHKIRQVSLGTGAGFHQLAISENGVARAITFQFGGMVELTPKLFYGAHIYNLFRSKLDKGSSIYYPVSMKTGFAYKPYAGFLISAEIEKDSRYDPNVKLGLEYKLADWFFVRTGINSNPSNGFLGVGLKLKEYYMDYGISFHSRLGFVHFFGLAKVFTKENVAQNVD